MLNLSIGLRLLNPIGLAYLCSHRISSLAPKIVKINICSWAGHVSIVFAAKLRKVYGMVLSST